MSEIETWKPVNIMTVSDIYEVSNLGRIRRSKSGPGTRKGKILRQYDNGNGYKAVCLTFSSRDTQTKQKFQYVHRIVALSFKGFPLLGQEVAHRNGIRSDNKATNVRWATRSENHADKKEHKTIIQGQNHKNSKLKESDFLIIFKLRRDGMSYFKIGTEVGVSEMTISNIFRGKTWKHVKVPQDLYAGANKIGVDRDR